MLLRARGSERARDSEQNRFLPLGEFRDRCCLHLAVGVEVGEGGFRELVADGDGGGDCGERGGAEGGEGARAGGEAEREFGREGFGWEERDGGDGGGGRDEAGQCERCHGGIGVNEMVCGCEWVGFRVET